MFICPGAEPGEELSAGGQEEAEEIAVRCVDVTLLHAV